MRPRSVKDVWAGLLFLAFGAAFLALAQSYQMGSARRMGPGYFPTVLSLVLIVVGLVTVARAFLVPGTTIRDVAVKPLALVTTAVVLFAVVVQGAGLGIASAVLVLVSALASPRSRVLPTLLLALVLAVFATLVFVVGLGLPFHGTWLRG